MKSAPNSQHKGYWGYTAKALITLIYLAFTITFIASAWSTHNFLFILGAVGGAFIILLQVKSFHDWFTDTFIPSLNKIEQDIIETIKPLAKKVRLPRTIITIIVLALIILGFVIKDYTSIPSMFQNHTSPNNGI